MIQTQVSLEEYQMKFLEQCQFYGFQDPSEVIRTALNRLSLELEQHSKLRESADLYVELYDTDEEFKELTELALVGWPT